MVRTTSDWAFSLLGTQCLVKDMAWLIKDLLQVEVLLVIVLISTVMDMLERKTFMDPKRIKLMFSLFLTNLIKLIYI